MNTTIKNCGITDIKGFVAAEKARIAKDRKVLKAIEAQVAALRASIAAEKRRKNAASILAPRAQ